MIKILLLTTTHLLSLQTYSTKTWKREGGQGGSYPSPSRPKMCVIILFEKNSSCFVFCKLKVCFPLPWKKSADTHGPRRYLKCSIFNIDQFSENDRNVMLSKKVSRLQFIFFYYKRRTLTWCRPECKFTFRINNHWTTETNRISLTLNDLPFDIDNDLLAKLTKMVFHIQTFIVK
jgi:hypothetical protein